VRHLIETQTVKGTGQKSCYSKNELGLAEFNRGWPISAKPSACKIECDALEAGIAGPFSSSVEASGIDGTPSRQCHKIPHKSLHFLENSGFWNPSPLPSITFPLRSTVFEPDRLFSTKFPRDFSRRRMSRQSGDMLHPANWRCLPHTGTKNLLWMATSVKC
jgi:hypothetical protein